MEYAFVMWANTGKTTYVDEALQTLDYDSYLWETIIGRVGRIFILNEEMGGRERYEKLLADLEENLTHPKSKSAVLLILVRNKRRDDKEAAIKMARQLVEINASEFYVDQGLGYLHEFKSLNIGQKAPDFKAQTLDGEPISITDFRGQYVLLDFWATWCGPCIPEIPHLKALWNDHKDANFTIMGMHWIMTQKL